MSDQTEKREEAFSFFENRDCRYYPCHSTVKGRFNCIFCYCPLYYAVCMGEPEYIQINGTLVKDCSRCDYPHRPESYPTIIEYLTLMLREYV
ncbi:MAG: cysteine-rich small domain-containing protein [bacterium]